MGTPLGMQVAVQAESRAPAQAHPPRPAGRWPDGVLVAVVALGTALRLWGLGAQSLWYDEWLTTEAVSGGLGELARHVANREGITPPYFVVMWAWARVVGDGEMALRSFSALAGLATVVVAYALARQLGQRRAVARAAALLVATNPLLLWYSQEARPYSLLALAGGLSVLAAARADRSGRRADVVVWGVVAAGAVAVHYFAVFLVLGEALGLLVRRRVPWRRVAAGVVPVGLVLMTLAPVAVKQHAHAANRSWISGFSLRSRIEEAASSALAGPSVRDGRLWLVVLAVVVAAAALAAGPTAGRDRRVALALVGLAGVGTLSPLAVSLAGVDVFLGRYLIAALVPLLTAVAVALVATRRPAVARVGGAAVVLVAGLWLAVDVAVGREPRLQRADWRSVAEVVAADAPGDRGGVLVVNVAGDQSSPLAHYLPGAAPLDRDRTLTTDRIDVLALRPAGVPCNFVVGRPCGFVFLGAPLPPSMSDDFHLDRRVVLDQFVVERYRADAPVAVGRDDLLAPADRASGRVWVL